MQQPPGWPPPGPGYPQDPGSPPPAQPPYPPNAYPQNPYGQGPYGQPPYPPPLPFAPAAPADPVAEAANLALGLGLGSLVLCCVPVGAVGAFFGFKSIRLAKERNVATPARALVGLALGALSLLATLGIGVGVWVDKRHHAERLAEVEAKTKGKLDAAELDEATAGAAFEKQLLKGLYDGHEMVKSVRCVGDYDTHGALGTLDDVTFEYGGETIAVRGCLVRANRWFVAGWVPFGAACPDVKLSAKKRSDASDDELDAQEDALRAAWRSSADARLADEASAKLASAAKLVAGDHVEKACKALDLGELGAPAKNATLRLSTVDAAYAADPKRAPAGWDFLTGASPRALLATDDDAANAANVTARADAARALAKRGGPFVVLFASADRALPEVKRNGLTGKGFVAGGFDGWLSVVDTRSGAIVCDAKLKFESSATVSTRRFASDDALVSALRADLVANYKKAAEAAIRDVSGGKLAIDD